ADEKCAIEALRAKHGDFLSVEVDESLPSKPAVGLFLRAESITDEDIRHIVRLPELEMVGLGPRSGISPKGISELAALKKLQRLDLAGTPLTEAALKKLQELPTLKALWLSDTKICDRELRHVGKLKTLERLWLAGTRITDKGLPELTPLKELKELYLFN